MLASALYMLVISPLISAPVVTQPPPQSQPRIHIDLHESDLGDLWRELRDADRQIDELEDRVRRLMELAVGAQADYRAASARAQQAAQEVQRAEAEARAAESYVKRLDLQLYRGFESSRQAQELKRLVNDSRRQLLELRRQAQSPVTQSPAGRGFAAASAALQRSLDDLRATAQPSLAMLSQAGRQWLRQQGQLFALLAHRLQQESQLAWYSLWHQQALAQLGQARQEHNESLSERLEWQRAQQSVDDALMRLLEAQERYQGRAWPAEAARRGYRAVREDLAIAQDRLHDARDQRERIARDLRRVRNELHVNQD